MALLNTPISHNLKSTCLILCSWFRSLYLIPTLHLLPNIPVTGHTPMTGAIVMRSSLLFISPVSAFNTMADVYIMAASVHMQNHT